VVQEEAEGKEALEAVVEEMANYHSGAYLLSLAFLRQSFFASLADFAL
jgi:hypothetical protein